MCRLTTALARTHTRTHTVSYTVAKAGDHPMLWSTETGPVRRSNRESLLSIAVPTDETWGKHWGGEQGTGG